MLGKKLINAGPVSSGANTFASENFNTVLYTGNGSTQRIGGYINRGAVFNGTTSSYIDYSPLEDFFHQKQTYSLSLWFYTSSTNSGGGTLFTDYAIQSFNILAYIQNGNIIVDSRYNSGGTTYTSSATYLNAWTHLCVTSDGTTRKVYVNGSLESTQTLSTNGWTSAYSDNRVQSGALWNDANNTQNNPYNGKLDQVRIFNKAISSSEVTTLYGETHASSTISTTDIFDDNSAIALYQLDGNANDTGGASGKYGSAAIFNGSSSKIDISGALTGITNNFSYSFWANSTTSSTNFIGIASNIASNTNRILFNFNQGGSYYFDFGNISSGGRISGSTPASWFDGDWHHFVVVKTPTSQLIYVDGVEFRNVTGQNSSVSGLTNFTIGNYTSNYTSGKIDDVRLYSDVLTSTEVGYLYNNTTASIPTDNLEAYYKLDGDARDEQQLYDGTATNVTYAYDGTATNVTYQEATKFQPDLVWVKSRSNTNNHNLFDSIRGATYRLFSNLNNVHDANGQLSSFNSNGFTVGPLGGDANESGTDMVAWCFKGGGTAVSNTDGNITSQVSVNQDAGFSIVEWTSDGSTGLEVGHGLAQQPELIINKRYSGFTSNWNVYTDVIDGSWDYLRLNTTDSKFDSADTQASSSLIRNTSTAGSFVAYCFHSVEGYSKVGSYTGTGAENSIVTGFEPAFVMVKLTSAIDGQWVIYDNKRSELNPRTKKLAANSSVAENDAGLLGGDTVHQVNFLSNGFELLQTGTSVNTNKSGETYIYLAIAADPDTTTPTVENSFDVVTYTGDGTTDHQINVDFKPDLVWIGGRTTANYLPIMDSVRGNESIMFSSLTGAASTYGSSWWNSYGRVKSFNSDGFILDYGSGSTSSNFNQNGQTYVAWCWKAGDHDDNLPQINTEGSIDSVTSVNAEAGFSIVKYSGTGSVGATVGHGLSSAPELYIIKEITAADDWMVVAKIGSSYQRGKLNTTDAFSTAMSGVTNSVDPTSTVITLGNSGSVNQSGQDYIGYFFHSVSGYQKIGSYSGTGSAGNAQNVGFAPRFVMVKSYSGSTSNWAIFDTNRDGFKLNANDNSADYADVRVDLTSTGFQFTGGAYNNSGVDWIYLAIK